METLYYSLHNFNKDYLEFETIRLWQKNNKGSLTIVSELERDLDIGFTVLDELYFHVEDWEEETTYLFEQLTEEETFKKVVMKTFEGKEERINGQWFPVVVKAENIKEARTKLYVGQRKSYGVVEAVRGRFVNVD